MAVEIPCGFDDSVDGVETWLPIQNFPGFFAGPDEGGWITGSGGGLFDFDIAIADFFHFINDFFDGIAIAISEIEGIADVCGFEVFESLDVGVGEVVDVDVVSDTGSVRGGVVGSEDFE